MRKSISSESEVMALNARNSAPLQQAQSTPQDDIVGEEGRKRIRTFNAQHTLDSDEEDEKLTAEEKNRMDTKAARQYNERPTILNDDGIKISPFNLKEEMRTGHFDRDGNYVFQQKRRRVGRMDEPANDDDDDDEDDAADAWLEGVDWAAVKARETDAIKAIKPVKRQLTGDENDTAEVADANAVGPNRAVQQPNDADIPIADDTKQLPEAASGDSKRANNSRPILRSNTTSKSSKQRVTWDASTKDEASASAFDDENANMSDDERLQLYRQIIALMQPLESVTKSIQRLGKESTGKDSVASLTGFVGELVDEGEYEVYDWTYEKLQHLINSGMPISENERASTQAASALDIFGGDDHDDQISSSAQTLSTIKVPSANANITVTATSDHVVYWLYKWENTDAAVTYGPFSSEQMQQWCDAGHFGVGVWVRRNDADKNAPFYTSKRVDFDLYT